MFWLSAALLAASVAAENLYATDYSGFLYSIDLNSTSGFSLTKTQQLQACGMMPSWLEFDGSTRTLYCVDEASPNGTLSTFAAAENGTLTQLANVETIGGGVDSVIYGGPAGNGFIAIAHYENPAVSTFKLPIVSSSKALQAFPFSLPHPGPNPVRQAIPHPHQVALDPSGQFILNPDLGADVVRVFAINQTSGILTQCPSLNATAGSGPRHVAFQVPSTATGGLRRRNVPPSQCLESTAVNGTIMYLASELANNLTAFNVDYTTNGCLAFTKKQTGYTFAGTPPPGSAVAEVRVLNQTLLVTNRNTSASLMDSVASFSLSPKDGSFKFLNTTPSYGSWPRTLSVNANRSYVAVGDQDDGGFAVVALNPQGQLGQQMGKIILGPGGTMGNGGLSSVIFEESEGGSEL